MNNQSFPFGPNNYRLMFVGLALIFGGFVIMSLDTAEFGFGLLGLTVGPLTIVAGFVVEFFAILSKPKSSK
jgi:Protein of unknown function (DUF3098)